MVRHSPLLTEMDPSRLCICPPALDTSAVRNKTFWLRVVAVRVWQGGSQRWRTGPAAPACLFRCVFARPSARCMQPLAQLPQLYRRCALLQPFPPLCVRPTAARVCHLRFCAHRGSCGLRLVHRLCAVHRHHGHAAGAAMDRGHGSLGERRLVGQAPYSQARPPASIAGWAVPVRGVACPRLSHFPPALLGCSSWGRASPWV